VGLIPWILASIRVHAQDEAEKYKASADDTEQLESFEQRSMMQFPAYEQPQHEKHNGAYKEEGCTAELRIN
jgi:hypothetical protein